VRPLPRRIEPAVGFGEATGLLHRPLRSAADELLDVALAVAEHLDPHLAGQRVHDAHSHAVEPAGDLVAAAAELPAGMEHGHDDLEGRLPGAVPVDRDAASIVDDLALAVAVECDVDAGRLVGHRLVDAVVDDLPDELVEATGIGRADIHARALADRLQPFENLDVGRGVARGLAARLRRSFDGHVVGRTSWSGWTGTATSADDVAPRVMMA
jgi:hypothetical protein